MMRTLVDCLILMYQLDRILAHTNRQTRRRRRPR